MTTLALVGGSAALVGGELRYRFPQDPLIVLVICGGVLALLAPVLAACRCATGGEASVDEVPARSLSGT